MQSIWKKPAIVCMHPVTGFTHASRHWLHTCIMSPASHLHHITAFTHACILLHSKHQLQDSKTLVTDRYQDQCCQLLQQYVMQTSIIIMVRELHLHARSPMCWLMQQVLSLFRAFRKAYEDMTYLLYQQCSGRSGVVHKCSPGRSTIMGPMIPHCWRKLWISW